MTYAVFDGTYWTTPTHSFTRVTRALVTAMVKQVGPGQPVDRLAVATLGRRVPSDLTRLGVTGIPIGLGFRTALLGQILPGVFHLARRIKPRPDVICWQILERFMGDVPKLRQVVIVHDLSIARYPQNHSWRTRFFCNTALHDSAGAPAG